MRTTDEALLCCGRKRPSFHQQGFTLIETIVFLLVVGIGVVGLLSAIGTAVRHSADPLPQKQALAIAEALMEEINAAGFTFCQAGTPNFASATEATETQCGVNSVESVGPETGEVRPYDNVNDYVAALDAEPVQLDVSKINASMPAPPNYKASISISQAGMASIPAADALRITLVVTGPNNTRVSLDSYRTRHAPRVSP